MKSSSVMIGLSSIALLYISLYPPENGGMDGITSPIAPENELVLDPGLDIYPNRTVINRLLPKDSQKPVIINNPDVIDFNRLLIPPLPSQAYITSMTIISDKSVVLTWYIRPETYLYKNKISAKLNSKSNIINSFVLTDGVVEIDPFFGEMDIYRDIARAYITFSEPLVEDDMIDITYQGCWDGGICYPPISESMLLTKD